MGSEEERKTIVMEEPKYKIKTAPLFEPVLLAEFKRNLHIGNQDAGDNAQDVYLQEILTAVIEGVQVDIGRQLARATYTLYLDDFPEDDLPINMGPIDVITSVKYYNSAGVLATMAPAEYQLDNIELTGRLRFLKTYDLYPDKMNAIEIELTNGWIDAASIPQKLKDAIILMATERYLNPENPINMKISAAENMLRGYRVQRF